MEASPRSWWVPGCAPGRGGMACRPERLAATGGLLPEVIGSRRWRRLLRGLAESAFAALVWVLLGLVGVLALGGGVGLLVVAFWGCPGGRGL